MCRHAYEYPGHRTCGDNVPGSAQGAYFPGDEPETRCTLTGEACGNPEGDTPGQCAAAKPSPWICPDCRELGFETRLLRLDDLYHCEGCGESWSEAELAKTFAASIGRLYDDCENAEQEIYKLQKLIAALRSSQEKARDALAEVAA